MMMVGTRLRALGARLGRVVLVVMVVVGVLLRRAMRRDRICAGQEKPA